MTTAPYCRSCYRTIESSRELCFDCEQRRVATSGPSRIFNAAGIVGLALFFLGTLTLNPRFSWQARLSRGRRWSCGWECCSGDMVSRSELLDRLSVPGMTDLCVSMHGDQRQTLRCHPKEL